VVNVLMGTSAWGLGQPHEAGIYLERSLVVGRQSQSVVQPSLAWVTAHYRSTGREKRAIAFIDSLLEVTEVVAARSPDNLRVRGARLSLLALRGDRARFLEEWRRSGPALLAAPQFGFSELPFGLAQAGDLLTATELLADFRNNGEVVQGLRILERGGPYTGGKVPEMLASPEYGRARARIESERARLLAHLGPLVDRATSGAVARPRASATP
jgi:hypothetical protein